MNGKSDTILAWWKENWPLVLIQEVFFGSIAYGLLFWAPGKSFGEFVQTFIVVNFWIGIASLYFWDKDTTGQF